MRLQAGAADHPGMHPIIDAACWFLISITNFPRVRLLRSHCPIGRTLACYAWTGGMEN